VRVARVALPVAALLLLSSLFLLARTVDPDEAVQAAEVDVSERVLDRMMTAPRVTGMSDRGTAYRLVARQAMPTAADPRRLVASVMELTLRDEVEEGAVIRAREGVVDTGRRDVVLDGDVRIETTGGFDIRSDLMEGRLDRLDILSPGPVTGVGPIGDLSAGSMRVTEDEAGRQRLLFTGGVDLLYLPPVE
jgi:lipopolysaccharide export system protein LptC